MIKFKRKLQRKTHISLPLRFVSCFSEVFRAVDIIANEYLPIKRLKFFMSKENRSQLVSTVIYNSNIDR